MIRLSGDYYGTLQYRTVPYHTIQYCTILYCTVPYHSVLNYTVRAVRYYIEVSSTHWPHRNKMLEWEAEWIVGMKLAECLDKLTIRGYNDCVSEYRTYRGELSGLGVPIRPLRADPGWSFTKFRQDANLDSNACNHKKTLYSQPAYWRIIQ